MAVKAKKLSKLETSAVAVLKEKMGAVVVPILPPSMIPQGKPQEPWSTAKVQKSFDDFSNGYSNAYGHVTAMARAWKEGAVTDEQVRDLWAANKERDNARKFLAAFKEAMRTVQANAEGNLPDDAVTFNVNPKTGVLVRETVQSRERTFSGAKLAAKVARLVIKYKLDSKQRERLAAMLSEACINAEAFSAGAKA